MKVWPVVITDEMKVEQEEDEICEDQAKSLDYPIEPGFVVKEYLDVAYQGRESRVYLEEKNIFEGWTDQKTESDDEVKDPDNPVNVNFFPSDNSVCFKI